MRDDVVWYWVKIADELIEKTPPPHWRMVGLRLIDAAPYQPGDGLSRWWRVEDVNAGPEFAGHKVHAIVTRTDGVDGPAFHLTRTLLDA